MNPVYIFKNSLQNEQQIQDIRSHFKKASVIEFEDFYQLGMDTLNGESLACLITLDQVKSLDKSMFRRVIQLVGVFKYILIIQPEQVSMVKRLMKTGTKSLVLLDDPIEFIVDAIEKTIAYGGYISPRIVALLNVENKNLVDLQYKITDRQRIILQELLNGKSDKMIASSLSISYHTMKTHRKKLFKMFRVNSQGELFALLG